MKYVLFIFIFISLITINFSSETSNLELTNSPSIVRNVLYFLSYPDVFKIINQSPKLRIENNSFTTNDNTAKKIFIYLSKLRIILLNTPRKFQKRFFQFNTHVEYTISSFEENNTEFLPDKEELPIYTFFILHAIRFEIKGNVKYIILRTDGVCHIFNTTKIFEKIGELGFARIYITNVSEKILNSMYYFHSIVPILNKNIHSIFFSFDLIKKRQVLHLFFQAINRHLSFYWSLENVNMPQICELPRYCTLQIYQPTNIYFKLMRDSLGYFVYDKKSKILYHNFYKFQENKMFLENLEIFKSNVNLEEYNSL